MIKVHVVSQSGRNLVMRYTDPETGKHVARTTGTTDMRKARSVASKWEDEINSGKFATGSNTTWGAFRERYEREALKGLKPSTLSKAVTILDMFEAEANPKKIGLVNFSAVQKYLASLRDKGRTESTLASHSGHLRSALNWAWQNGMMNQKVVFKKIQRAKKSSGTPMKGRPLTEEEFQRMLDCCPDDHWRFYLRGLWLSGMRLEESLDFWWDREDKLHLYDGMLRVFAEDEKGATDRLMPLTPDFVDFLDTTPSQDRHGRVFQPYEFTGVNRHWASRTISRIGKQAGIVVNQRTGKFASAHDLRRSFGERWAMRVMPQVLTQLMRHSSIETTMRYYVGRNAKKIMDDLRSLGSDSGSSGSFLDTQNETQVVDTK